MAGKNGGARPGAGRKKGFAAIQAEMKRDLTARLLQKEWTPMVKRLIKEVKLRGSVEAFKTLRDSAYGKPKETADINVSAFSLLDLGAKAKDDDDEE